MSALAMYYLAYGTMPDELFTLLLLGPLGFILAIGYDWWRGFP